MKQKDSSFNKDFREKYINVTKKADSYEDSKRQIPNQIIAKK